MSAIMYKNNVYGAGGSGGGGGGTVTDVKVDSQSVVDGNGVANINTMTGAGSGSAGAKGLVPAPASGDNDKYLKGDGTWGTPSGGTGSILYGTSEPTSQIGSDGDLYYQYETSQSGGWTADSEYLVSTANSEFAYDGNRHWTKTNAGKAIAVYLSGTWSGGMLVSQDPQACYYSNEGGTVNTNLTAVIDGVTWYSSTPGAWLHSVLQNQDGVAPTVSHSISQSDLSNGSVVIPFVLQAANMRYEQSASSLAAVYFKKDGEWLPDTRYLEELGDIAISSPTDGQVLKYNGTSQKWENSSSGGGASTVSDLTDVSLSSLANGQILKYNSTTQKWENANESGGGGGGSGYTETTLFTGTYQSYSGEITLDDDLDNYDQIIIWARWTATSTNGATPFLVEREWFVSHCPYDNGSTAQTTNHMVLCPYDNQYIRVKCGSANNKLFLFDAHSIAIERVVGLKYGGSSGGSYTRTALFESSTGWGVWDQTNGIALSDDIENYDEIEFVLAFAASDKSKRTNKFGAKWFADNCGYTSAAASADHALLLLWPNQGFPAAWDSANQKIMMWGRNGTAGLYAVYGIKY